MNYATTIIQLDRGLRDENGIEHKELILREMIVKDLLSPHSNLSDDARGVHILAQRVLQIGNIKNPGMALVEKLNFKDYSLIVAAANKMDE